MLDKPGMELIESRPPPRGGTWRDQIKEEAYKLRQRQREADSPEFISPHSTTDTMDTDEAQEINKQIMEKIENEPEGSEYLNIVSEGNMKMWGKHWIQEPPFQLLQQCKQR